MLEWLAIPAAIGVAAFIPKKSMSDEKKIEQIFINRKVCIVKESKNGDKTIKHHKYPKLKRKIQNVGYTTYIYTLPLGLDESDIEKVLPALQDGLNKEVEMELDGMLKLSVYSTKLSNWNYEESLLRPNTWEVPIGKNHQGILYHDFDKYAHFLVGGVPGFGKTVFMKSVFNTLLLNNPDDVQFYILDLKGGLEFSKFAGLPQVKMVAADVFEAAETLNEIVEEMKGMEKHFRQKGYTNITETPIKKRTFIIVDEGAELSPDIITADKKKYAQFCQAALSEIARIGRAVGYRLIYATQYPSAKSVNMSIKMNIVSRISFVAASQISSRVILDEVGAEDLPAIPGRAIYKVEKKRNVQVPYITDSQMFKMMEERKDELTTRKPVTDDRPARHDKDKTLTKNT